MAWDKGFNFRASLAFVTDGPNDVFVGFDSAYPITTGGRTFGWEVAANDERNRDAGLDPRLAGVNWGLSGDMFRVDLPNAGDFAISLAIGDASFAATDMGVDVKDTSTIKFSLIDKNVSAGQWWDASGVLRTSAALWIANNVAVTVTFATTILRVELKDTGLTVISHLFVSEVVAEAPSIDLVVPVYHTAGQRRMSMVASGFVPPTC